jgi:hypothetical protein
MRKALVPIILPALGLMVLILDAKTALIGANDGVRLCLQTVIPSLFPFLVLSNFLTAHLIGKGSLRFMEWIWDIPNGTGSLLAVGFLGGYPVGARQIGEAYDQKLLGRDDAQRMLMFSNNAGPSFLFGMVASKFDHPLAPWLLWAIMIISSALVAIVFPSAEKHSIQCIPRKNITFTESVSSSVRTIASICGWVLLFRIMIAFFDRWIGWLLPDEGQVILEGILELSNGCCSLDRIADPRTRFIAAAGLLTFGGLCVAMQTATVTRGLDLRYYWFGKALQCLFSVLLATGKPIIMLSVLIICLLSKIRGRNPVNNVV